MARGNQARTKKHRALKNRRIATGKVDPERQEPPPHPISTGPTGQIKYGTIEHHKLHEMKRGALYNTSGTRVDRRNEAIFIARDEARRAGARNVPPDEKTKRSMRAQAKDSVSKKGAA
jgi:hypothetical protein